MKKKLMASILCLSLLLIMLLGSTLAWFTDDVGTTNTMVVGNVKIEQHEKYRDETGVLIEWTDAYKPAMFPVVPKGDGQTMAGANVTIDNTGYALYNQNQNVIDKIVTVENTGDSAAYVRTVFAFEMMKKDDGSGNITWENPLDQAKTKVHLNVNEPEKLVFANTAVVIYKYQNGTYGVDSTNAVAAYVVGVYTYQDALAAPAENTPSVSTPSLLQVYLDKSVGNEFYDAVGTDGYQILVLSQAVQTQGFEAEQNGRSAAEVALDTAFGAVNAENAAEWFANMQ